MKIEKSCSNSISYVTRHRNEFAKQLQENSLAIIPNKPISIRSNDVEYKFKPDSDFYYLTGFDEPNSICVLKKEKNNWSYILFVEPQDKEKEIWTGKRTGTEGAKSIYKADEAYLISEFDEKFKTMIRSCNVIYYSLGKDKELDLKITNLIQHTRSANRSGVAPIKSVCEPSVLVHKMRLIKDKYEISCINQAIEIAKEAFGKVLIAAKAGMFEYELEALIEHEFRALGGNGSAYPSIVASGKKAAILHYTQNSKKIKKGELILIDAGCEYNYYASDITRTFPSAKKFTSVQKDLYNIVLEAQLKAIELIKTGKRFIDSYNKAVSILVEGLKELKLLKGSIDEIIKKEKYKKFFMHKLGHWLGLDVHDVGPYIDPGGKSIMLQEGMIVTAEPGIYISPELEDVPKWFRGIGIRIEDDVLVTKDGNKVLTRAIPKTVAEIEAIRNS